MNSPTSSLAVAPLMPTKACIRCSDRKVRCDRKIPCDSCTRHNVQCVYRPPKPSQRQRRLVKDRLVDERLKRYETFLKTNGVDPEQVASGSLEGSLEVDRAREGGLGEADRARESGSSDVATESSWQMPTPPSTVSGPQETIFKPHLHREKLVDNTLWLRVAEEMHNGEDAQEEESMSDSEDGASNDDFVYVLGWKMPNTSTWHPPAQIIHQLWQTFLENVDPLSKAIHVPTLQPAIEKAIASIETIPKGFEALMFAIYSTAVLSLTESECQTTLGESRTVLFRRYVAATKVALSRAKFMSSTSIVVLQALMLHIFSIRETYDPRAVWSLIGAALRIADGMGMSIDGTLLGLSPFETEIRRRIWWLLKMADLRASELAGQAKFRDLELTETTPKPPANVNDIDIYPEMTEPPVGSTKPTEMTWSTLRVDLATFAASQKVKLQSRGKTVTSTDDYAAMDDLSLKDTMIAGMEDMLETKYLRFCNPSRPIQLLTLLAGRGAANTVRFMAHHPRRWSKMDQVPASEEALVWDTAIQLLEQYNMMQSNPQIARFAWSAAYFIQWQAVIHILDTLRAHPLCADATKAWKLMNVLYDNNAEMLLNTNKPIYISVGNLCLKAFSARTAALARENRPPSGTPDYIVKLREQRDAAKARKEAASVKSQRQEALDGVRRLTTSDITDAGWPNVDASQTQTMPLAQPPALTGFIQPNQTTGDDAFWLNDSRVIDFSTIGAADTMNVDTDAILTQDSWLDTSGNDAIDWTQWDAWLGGHALAPITR